jgi:hypothetical protein
MSISIHSIVNNKRNQCDLNPLAHAKAGDWCIARNEYLETGRRVLAEGRVMQALNLFLYVCALDLNGAQDRSDSAKFQRNDSPGFDPSIAFLAPDVVEDLRWTAVAIGIGMHDLRTCFLRIAAAEFFPVPAQKSWSVLDLALHGNIDLKGRSHCYQPIVAKLIEQKNGAIMRSVLRIRSGGLKSIMSAYFPCFYRRGERECSRGPVTSAG